MKIFIAEASKTIDQPLVAKLIRQKHQITNMTHSNTNAERLTKTNTSITYVSAFDTPTLKKTLHHSSTKIVIDQLTSLPQNPSKLAAALPDDRKLRIENNSNLLRTTQTIGTHRYIQQANDFFLKPGQNLKNKSESLAMDTIDNVGLNAKTYTKLEARLFSTPTIKNIALRYDFFYDPNT